MPKLQVLINGHGEVLGTMQADGKAGGTAPPDRLGFFAGPGQRLIEVDVDESVARLDPAALHAKLKADHLA